MAAETLEGIEGAGTMSEAPKLNMEVSPELVAHLDSIMNSPEGQRSILAQWALNALNRQARIAELEDAVRAALNMVDGDGAPPDWDRLRELVSK
jgi:hypothetical protein